MIKTDGINTIEPKIIYIGLDWTVCIWATLSVLFLYCGFIGKTSQTQTTNTQTAQEAFNYTYLKAIK